MRKVLAIAALAAFTSAALAAPPPPPPGHHGPKPATLRMGGEGDVSVAPTLARISGGVVSSAETAADALAANNKAMTGVVDAFKKQGIEPKDISTSNFSVEPQYVYEDENNRRTRPPKIVGYEVRNTVNVTIRDLKKLGSVLDVTVSSGANNIGNISFDVENASKLQDDARRKAFEDAHRKAQLYADAAKLKLGRVMSITENTSGAVPMRPRMMMEAMKAAAPQSTPIEQGELNLNTQVEVEWELAPQ
jgi:uncharacterized protein